MSRVLFIMTGADEFTLADGSRIPTGFWANEAVEPLQVLTAAGHEVAVATPGGVVPPVDPSSADSPGLRAAAEGAYEFAHPVPLADVDPAGFDAVFVPGGHGPMEDLAADADAGRVLRALMAAGRPVAAVCHGPAALLSATDGEGRSPFAGYALTSFTDEEEALSGLAPKLSWLVESRLRAAGADFRAGAPWAAHVETDRNVLTGQNPASAEPLARALVERLPGPVQNAVAWPQRYLPGTTDNFVSNEAVVPGLSAARVWGPLTDTSRWEDYYDNVSDISFPDGQGPVLAQGVHFSFATFGFPPLDATAVQFDAPAPGRPGRLSWTARQEGSPAERLDVLHAWLVEDLPGGRVRILTQESQIGEPAAGLARQRPNPMLNGHQAWVDGLVEAAAHD